MADCTGIKQTIFTQCLITNISSITGKVSKYWKETNFLQGSRHNITPVGMENICVLTEKCFKLN